MPSFTHVFRRIDQKLKRIDDSGERPEEISASEAIELLQKAHQKSRNDDELGTFGPEMPQNRVNSRNQDSYADFEPVIHPIEPLPRVLTPVRYRLPAAIVEFERQRLEKWRVGLRIFSGLSSGIGVALTGTYLNGAIDSSSIVGFVGPFLLITGLFIPYLIRARHQQ